MEENVSFWSKQSQDLNVGEQMKVIALAPVVAMTAVVVPLIVFGKTMELLERRKLKRQNKLAIVTNIAEEA